MTKRLYFGSISYGKSHLRDILVSVYKDAGCTIEKLKHATIIHCPKTVNQDMLEDKASDLMLDFYGSSKNE